jgi:hypothetical protein
MFANRTKNYPVAVELPRLYGKLKMILTANPTQNAPALAVCV